MSARKYQSGQEWHLYSALAITCALTIIAITFFRGTPQVLGAALGPVVGGFFGMSNDWKHQPIAIHKWTIVIPFIAIGVVVLMHSIYQIKSSIITKDNN